MSLAAMSFVFTQDIRPSSLKFVLLALADSADGDGVCWPSIDKLCEKTSQNRKTVIGALSELESRGLLFDTGKRFGKTGKVKVYRLNGLPNSAQHYVYRLTNPQTGEFYIGVRSTSGSVEHDPYMGSGVCPNTRDRRNRHHHRPELRDRRA